MTLKECPNCKAKRQGSKPEMINSTDDQCRHCHGIDVQRALAERS